MLTFFYITHIDFFVNVNVIKFYFRESKKNIKNHEVDKNKKLNNRNVQKLNLIKWLLEVLKKNIFF